jgi:hypothetical protein
VRRVDGVVLDGQEAALAAWLIVRGIRYTERTDATIPGGAVKLLAELSAFARESTLVEVSAVRESGKAAVVTVEAGSLTTAQAAALLDLTRQQVGALCRDGALAAERTAAGPWRIDPGSAAALAARRKKGNQSGPL